MAEFTVSEVIDGDTFKVKNGWKWENKTLPTSWVPRLSLQLVIILQKKMKEDIHPVR